ncbi:MAG: hypothetical protein GWM98_01070 [Nitrospinaceae bacterium]|nr:hypothetical protein [Nitrospinaceae bacterium]NIR53348.1 hypothetical protein [Nitrospinaceae bacterium]NIS83748.1 hypothetical protein [Nitrospinaceae bacterium]NIT80547.1 hypothetical protein [Nitrospinaceae bacterium]NIU42872.1 hypothetical protein [Nitrospinaceae bacterium]
MPGSSRTFPERYSRSAQLLGPEKSTSAVSMPSVVMAETERSRGKIVCCSKSRVMGWLAIWLMIGVV